jgi:hypothetical protein
MEGSCNWGMSQTLSLIMLMSICRRSPRGTFYIWGPGQQAAVTLAVAGSGGERLALPGGHLDGSGPAYLRTYAFDDRESTTKRLPRPVRHTHGRRLS